MARAGRAFPSRRNRILLSPSVAAPLSGILGASFQKAVTALAGSQIQSGSIASSMARALFAGSGNAANLGTLLAAFQAPLFAGTGLHSQTGVLTATQRQALFTGAGAAANYAVLSGRMQALLFAAISNAVAGALAAQMSPARFSANAIQIITGEIGVTMQKLLVEWYGRHGPDPTVGDDFTAGRAPRTRESRHVGAGHKRIRQRY